MVRAQTAQKITPVIIILVLTAYQLIRLIAFINIYGGLEFDSGWLLSISRSLAEQGTYTTMVSTLVDPTVPGGINIDEKFDIQAADGRIWFFTGNGIGPASIVPDALVLKLFGAGFWALRAGPLIFYTLFLLLAALILYRLAGLWAVGLFHAYLFFYPHLSIFLGYEAMGEVPAMVYILWAYLAFAWALKKQPQRWWQFLLAGFVIGLALNAKLIAMWSLGGIFIWAVFLWLKAVRRQMPENTGTSVLRFCDLAALAGGSFLPPALWELVQFIVLNWITTFELYRRHLDQRIKFILDDGSGVGLQAHSGAEFFWDKFFLLTEIAHPQRWVTALIFIAIFLGGLVLLWLWCDEVKKQNLLAPVWLGWLTNTLWFVLLAKTGWTRHFWFGLVLGILLMCIITMAFIHYSFKTLQKMRRENFSLKTILIMPATTGLLLLLIGWGFFSQPYVWGFSLPDEIVSHWREKQINNKYGASLPWIIIPRTTQNEIVDHLQQLPPDADIYYPAHHKTAELPVRVGRIFYPLARRPMMTPHPQDVVIIGPSLISPWLEPARRQALQEVVQTDCPQPLLANDFYMICPFPAQ